MSRRFRSGPQRSVRVYVGNLRRDVRVRDLEEAFSRYSRRFDCMIKNGFAFLVSLVQLPTQPPLSLKYTYTLNQHVFFKGVFL